MYELLIKHGAFGLIAVFRGDRQNGSLEYIVLKNSWLRNSGRFSPSQRHAQCHSLKFAAPKTISDCRNVPKIFYFQDVGLEHGVFQQNMPESAISASPPNGVFRHRLCENAE
jgi:hypothetical protein